jgi:hypothetical protein
MICPITFLQFLTGRTNRRDINLLLMISEHCMFVEKINIDEGIK